MGLSPCGRDWLIAALDPFHDNQLEHLSGWPDEVTTPSVLRQVKASLPISFAPGVPLDVHIEVWPWLNNMLVSNFTTAGGGVIALPATSGPVAVPPVSVYQVTPGSAPNFTLAPTSGLIYPASMQASKGRLVGMGLEVLNVTAPIQRSGTIYTWRMPGLEEEVETYQYTTGGLLTRVGSTRRTTTPPQSVANAELLPGTRSWAAEEGAYMIMPFVGDNPALYPTTLSPIYNTTGTGALQVDNTNTGMNIMTGIATAGSNLNRLIPSNLFGAILTGLNDQAKLTINVVWFYEEFPDISSPVLTLATPSCEYDPVALALYTEVLSSLPIAVPSSWNTEGSWWWDVVTAIKDHANSVGMILGGRQGALLGTAASQLAGWSRDRYLTSPGSAGSSIPQKGYVQGRTIPQQQKKKNNNKQKKQSVVIVEKKKPTKAQIQRVINADKARKIAEAKFYESFA